MELDKSCQSALERLYDAGRSVSFDAMGLSGAEALCLYDAGYIDISQDRIINVPGNRLVVSGSEITITPQGKAYVERLREQRRAKLAEQNESRAEKRENHTHDFILVFLTALLTLVVEYLVKKFPGG